MESSLAILIPVSLVLVFVIGALLWWAVRSGQFEDLEGEAFRVMTEEDPPVEHKKNLEHNPDKD